MADVAIAAPGVSTFLVQSESKHIDPALWRKQLRRRLFMGFGALLVATMAASGAWYFKVSQRYVSTDDAYVNADSAQITPQINGTILAVPVTDTTHVRRGQLLVRIDPADSELALAQAEANYGQAVRHVRQYYADAAEDEAQIAGRNSDVSNAQIQYDRRVALAKQGAIADEQLTTARNTLETTQAALLAAKQTLAAQEALIRGTDVDHNPEVLAAKSALDTARLDFARTLIRAPFEGVVAQKTAQIGQRVQVGQALMNVVPVNRAYVDANFKEGQLTRVHPGQTVTLTSDLYGSHIVFHGRVQGLSGGTGAAFAVIPAQNATGNWIKVVQRLPVRVALDPNELAAHPLRVGLSMTATIELAQ